MAMICDLQMIETALGEDLDCERHAVVEFKDITCFISPIMVPSFSAMIDQLSETLRSLYLFSLVPSGKPR